MKTVFIFGAGVSVCAGAPLMANFIDRADYFRRRLPQELGREDFTTVFEALQDLRTIYGKAHLDLDNIEVLFGAVDMGLLLGRLGNRQPDQVRQLRAALVRMIVRTVEDSMAFTVNDGTPTMPSAMSEFTAALMRVETRSRATGDPQEFSFLTFNYDVLLELAFLVSGTPYDYFLGDRPAPRPAIPLLKLHGSISWVRCPGCNAIVPFDLRTIRLNRTGRGPIRVSEMQRPCVHAAPCSHSFSTASPFLVPPTADKAAGHGELRKVWSEAAQRLSEAENLFIVGYSLPETDTFFRYLYALGSDSPTRLLRVFVVNPEATEGSALRARYDAMLGSGLRNRVYYRSGSDGSFEALAHLVIQELGG